MLIIMPASNIIPKNIKRPNDRLGHLIAGGLVAAMVAGGVKEALEVKLIDSEKLSDDEKKLDVGGCV